MEAKPINKLKFYADLNETINKRFTYNVYDVNHCIDLLNKFVHQGWKIRMAYFESPNGKNISLKAILKGIDGDLSSTYATIKDLDKKLDKIQNQD